MAQQKYSDNMAQDAASVANAAIQTTKDAKTVAAAAGNLAAGNVVGAAKEVIKNPHIIKMILAVILAALFLIFVVFITPIVLLFSIPGSIISAIQDATNRHLRQVQLIIQKRKHMMFCGENRIFKSQRWTSISVGRTRTRSSVPTNHGKKKLMRMS